MGRTVSPSPRVPRTSSGPVRSSGMARAFIHNVSDGHPLGAAVGDPLPRWEHRPHTLNKDTGTHVAGNNGITVASVASAQPWRLHTGTQSSKVICLRALPGGRTWMLTNRCLFFPFQ